MLRVTQYTLHPRCCGLCRQPRLPAIDTLIDEETPITSTRLYVCAMCAEQMFQKVAATVGKAIVGADELAKLRSDVEELERKAGDSQVLAEMFRATLAGVAEATKDKFGVSIEDAIAQVEAAAVEEVGR